MNRFQQIFFIIRKYFNNSELEDIFKETLKTNFYNYNVNNPKKNDLNIQKLNENLYKKIEDLNIELIKEKKMNKELKEENEKLLKELEFAKSNGLIDNNKDNKNKNELDLFKKLYEKDEELKNLQLKLARFPFELLEGEKLISVNFITSDQVIKCSVICKSNDIFVTVENRLYNKLSELKNNENYFLVNGKKIYKYLTLEENNIHDNDIIIMLEKLD